MKHLFVFFLLLLASSSLASAQGVELSGGYAHISGDGGLDGFNAGAALWLTNRVSIAVDYDSAWDNSHLGVFELTQTGVIITKSHLQDFLVGPRISFPGVLKDKKTHFPRLWPFAEVQLGGSHLSSSLVRTRGEYQPVCLGQCVFMDGWRRSRLPALVPLGGSL